MVDIPLHQLQRAGQDAQINGKLGSGCGTHTYKVDYGTSAITFSEDGTQYGAVTAVQIGVPLATDPMYAIEDYGAGSDGGPTTAGAVMSLSAFSATKD